MENFEALQSIDNFCKVVVKKTTAERTETGSKRGVSSLLALPEFHGSVEPEIEDPLVDIFDEEDYVRILVQCRCREEQVTFHPDPDGITVCREECHREKHGPEMCRDVCQKLNLRTDELQLGSMEFVIAKCNNNNTLEALIPKLKK
jgi:hypothetical protein